MSDITKAWFQWSILVVLTSLFLTLTLLNVFDSWLMILMTIIVYGILFIYLRKKNMGTQVLSEKSIKRYSRRLGIDIVSAIARGGRGHWILFVTKDHRHGEFHTGTLEIEWDDDPIHFSSCKERFEDEETVGTDE